ncbi:MAG: dockerin type I domain-containing protein [Oscillospiraceae bacterium]|nr:dockerin type I domain-containing protein [Oscillospiraceae bacterium]
MGTSCGSDGAGIGGGNGGDGSRTTTVTITGGYITASSSSGDCIGSGSGGAAVSVTITGGYFADSSYSESAVYGCTVADGRVVYANTDAGTSSKYPCHVSYETATLNSDGVYEISNAGQLFWFAALVSGDTTQEGITAANTGASAVLTADITIPDRYEWTPIGTKAAPYTGTFDGNGKTISGMSIETASTYMGLFGYVSAGTIKDLTVSGAISVSGNSLYAGGIVGTVSNGTLSNLTSNVSVTAYDGKKGTFGGVAATVEGGSTMELCTNNGNVTASGVLDCVGGLVGYMNSATITNCANYGTVDTSGGTAAASSAASAGIYTGGIVSYINHDSAKVTNCVNVGTITGVNSGSIVSYTGAIVGRINEHVGAVTNCYYLSSEGSTLAGVGGNGSGVTTYTTAKTAAEFASGEVAYLLQNGQTSQIILVWGQDLTGQTQTTDDDAYPVLNNMDEFTLRVVQLSFYYLVNDSADTQPFADGYTNYACALASYPSESNATYAYYVYDGSDYFSISTARAFGDDEKIYVVATYTVSRTLDSNVTSSNTSTGAARGDSYSTTLTAANGYSIGSVSVSMGGTDITASAYDSATGAVSISSVTGAIEITATATVGYTLRAAVSDSGPFNPGDTVTVKIYASAGTEAEVGSFQFTLDYDANALTLGSLAVTENLVSGASPNVTFSNDGAALSCTIGGSYTLTVSDTPVLLATATFTVNTGVSTGDTATISLTNAEVNKSATDASGTVTVEDAEVSFANITVTFQAGTGTSMTQQTAYAKYNLAGLYSDEARTTALTAETISGWVSAQTGYRLATEALWSDGTNATYTSASVLQQTFTQNVTLTAQAVQQYTVTFAAGANGSLIGDTTLTVDTGTTLTEVDVPTPIPNAGYVFDSWDTTPTIAPITADTTFTASFVDGTYSLTFPSVTGVTFIRQSEGNTVTHNTNMTFTIEASGVDVDAVYYTVANSGNGAVSITADGQGIYVVPGEAITGDVSITITATDLYTVTFAAGSNGSVGGTTSFNVRSGETLTAADLAAVTTTPEAGYVFYEWQDSSGTAVTPTEVEITGNTTFTAVFVDGTYAVTIPETIAVISGVDSGMATHDMNIVFTWDADTTSGKIVTGASYLIDGVDKGTLWADANGYYTIPGDAITGAVEISVTTVDGTLSFITKDSYMALADNTQILLIKTDKLDNGTYDRRDDGSVLYYSSAYGGYVYIVPDTETAEMAAANLALLSGVTGIDIGYSGDLNGDGAATTVDAMIVNDILHDLRESTSMLQYLEADVTGNGTVDTTDILWIQQKAVGLTPSATDATATGNEGENV